MLEVCLQHLLRYVLVPLTVTFSMKTKPVLRPKFWFSSWESDACLALRKLYDERMSPCRSHVGFSHCFKQISLLRATQKSEDRRMRFIYEWLSPEPMLSNSA